MQHAEATPITSLLDVGEHFTHLPEDAKSSPSELLQSDLLQTGQGLNCPEYSPIEVSPQPF